MINFSLVPRPTQKINISVTQYEKVLFSGEAFSFSSFNEKGRFDILYSHIKFITIINKSITIVDTNHKDHNYNFDRAILHCHTNNISVFLGI